MYSRDLNSRLKSTHLTNHIIVCISVGDGGEARPPLLAVLGRLGPGASSVVDGVLGGGLPEKRESD